MSFEAGRCGMHPYRKDIYMSHVFSLLDYACQVRHIGLTVLDSYTLKGIQKRAMTIAFPELSYECAVKRDNINTIHIRRKGLHRRCFKSILPPLHTQTASSIVFSRVLSHNFGNKTKLPALRARAKR